MAKRLILLIIIMLLTLYPAIELTRLILIGSWYHQHLALPFTGELAVIWSGWAIVPLFYYIATRRR